MITRYYIRGTSLATTDWALVEQDERYDERVVVDGLSYKDAAALYWRKLAELTAPVDPAAAPAQAQPRQRLPPQLSLKL